MEYYVGGVNVNETVSVEQYHGYLYTDQGGLENRKL